MEYILAIFFGFFIYYVRYFKFILSFRTKEIILPKYLYFKVDISDVTYENLFDSDKTHNLMITLYDAFKPDWIRANAYISSVFEDIKMEINRNNDMDIVDKIIELVENISSVGTTPIFVYKNGSDLRYMKVLIYAFDIDNRTTALKHMENTYMNGCVDYLMKEYGIVSSENKDKDKDKDTWDVIYNNISYDYSQNDCFVRLMT
jgi:hypothetical protein